MNVLVEQSVQIKTPTQISAAPEASPSILDRILDPSTGEPECHDSPKDCASITPALPPSPNGLGRLNSNPAFSEDELLRLRDELAGLDPDDFGDTDAVFTQLAANIFVRSQSVDLVRELIVDTCMLVWPLIEDGVISATRAQARLDAIVRNYVSAPAAAECTVAIDFLLALQHRCIRRDHVRI
jgi:hypothetical protein